MSVGLHKCRCCAFCRSMKRSTAQADRSTITTAGCLHNKCFAVDSDSESTNDGVSGKKTHRRRPRLAVGRQPMDPEPSSKMPPPNPRLLHDEVWPALGIRRTFRPVPPSMLFSGQAVGSLLASVGCVLRSRQDVSRMSNLTTDLGQPQTASP